MSGLSEPMPKGTPVAGASTSASVPAGGDDIGHAEEADTLFPTDDGRRPPHLVDETLRLGHIQCAVAHSCVRARRAVAGNGVRFRRAP